MQAGKNDIHQYGRKLECAERTLSRESFAEEDKNPQGLAATALYIACTLEGISTTQKEIAVAAGVTEVTMRNRSKGLRELAAQTRLSKGEKD